ncbi:hypothetical protein SCALM49S_01210 [Streptomyces californicus]
MLPLPAPAALTRLLIPFAREVSDHFSDAAALLDTLLPFASARPLPPIRRSPSSTGTTG